jgi:hypothetical protein
VKPELLASFVECLVADLGDRRAREILATVAERTDLDPAQGAALDPTDASDN